MGIIRKRLATSREPSSATQDDAPTNGDPARPLDECAPSTPLASGPSVKRSKRANDITRPLVIVRVRSRPRQLAPPIDKTGAPDWSLSAGVAIVLFGFAIAFGTYVTLTAREAAQTQLRRFAKHEEPRPAAQPAQRELVLPAIPAAQIAEVPSRAAEIPAASKTATIDTQPSHTPSAPSVAVARNKPPDTGRSPTDASTVAPAKPATKRNDPPATPALAHQAPRSTDEQASTGTSTRTGTGTGTGTGTSAMRAHAASPAPKTNRASPTTAGLPLASAQGSPPLHNERTVHEPAITRPLARTAAATTAPRDNVPNVSETPAIPAAAAPAQPHGQTEITASLQSTVNRELFRRH
ncbi:hypothetical protein PPMP20_03135 [Paraburkholderia phymatum]|uniref:Transmembrane protein n=1 Tax=Paraburkholderia phymatum (strain DSM 17167 / CIP 108236 / LMG 21445 / STM815) TaxID=391038 RepID=B2JWV5_PARP8|nr:hypothetical protein [Paraburkholderia phymatum]ACC75432.1 hypothetical protein Bphy_6402 [Paraburkholderia phymatum STM815]